MSAVRPAVRWSVAYERSCAGSIAPVAVGPRGMNFAYCDAWFEGERGAFRGKTRLGVLALLEPDRALVWPYDSEQGLGAGPLEGDAYDARAPGVSVGSVAIAPDRARVVLSEWDATGANELGGEECAGATCTGAHAIVVRTLPQLTVASRVVFDGAGDVVAFLSDGRPIVLTSYPCRTTRAANGVTETTCDGRGVFVAQGAGLVSLGGRFASVSGMAVAASGRRAVLVRPSGEREVVSLPEGRRIAPLPPESCPGEESRRELPVGIDAEGTRVAYADCGSLQIAEVDEGAVRVVGREAIALENHGALAFSPDGTRLFAWDFERVQVLVEGAVPRREAFPVIAFTPPSGFRSAIFREVNGIREATTSSFESESELARPGLIARYHRDERGRGRRWQPDVDVWAYASDAFEFDARGLDAWRALVLARYAEFGAKPHVLRAWEDDLGRSVEYAVFRRDGCDPADEYVRLTERGRVLYRVVMRVPPRTRRADVPFEAIFEAPFGPAGPARVAVRSPPFPREPC